MELLFSTFLWIPRINVRYQESEHHLLGPIRLMYFFLQFFHLEIPDQSVSSGHGGYVSAYDSEIPQHPVSNVFFGLSSKQLKRPS